MVGHGGSSAGSYLADPTSPIPSHCASIVTTSTLRVKMVILGYFHCIIYLANNLKTSTSYVGWAHPGGKELKLCMKNEPSQTGKMHINSCPLVFSCLWFFLVLGNIYCVKCQQVLHHYTVVNINIYIISNSSMY